MFSALALESLQHSDFGKNALRRLSFTQQEYGGLFLSYLFQCMVNHLHFHLLRKDDNPVNVAEDDVAWLDGDLVDLQSRAEIDHPPTSALILRIATVAEDGKVHGENSVGVARESGEHSAGCTAGSRCGTHQFTP